MVRTMTATWPWATAFLNPKRYYQNCLGLFHLIDRIRTHMLLHRAIDDKALDCASTIARGLPRTASEQNGACHVRRIPRGEILHVSEHVSRRSWAICSVMELQCCSR